MWKELSEEERNEFNRRALSEDVITKKEQIKRTLKKVKREVTPNGFGGLILIISKPKHITILK